MVLLLVLMIALGSLDCIFWNTNLMFVLHFLCFKKWSALSLESKNWTNKNLKNKGKKKRKETFDHNGKDFLIKFSHLLYRKNESFIKPNVRILHNKVVPLKKNRHLLEVTQALFFHKDVPKSCWGEAVISATYLINGLPSRILEINWKQLISLNFFPQFDGLN